MLMRCISSIAGDRLLSLICFSVAQRGPHFVSLRYAPGKPLWFTISVLLALRDAYDWIRHRRKTSVLFLHTSCWISVLLAKISGSQLCWVCISTPRRMTLRSRDRLWFGLLRPKFILTSINSSTPSQIHHLSAFRLL